MRQDDIQAALVDVADKIAKLTPDAKITGVSVRVQERRSENFPPVVAYATLTCKIRVYGESQHENRY